MNINKEKMVDAEHFNIDDERECFCLKQDGWHKMVAYKHNGRWTWIHNDFQKKSKKTKKTKKNA